MRGFTVNAAVWMNDRPKSKVKKAIYIMSELLYNTACYENYR